MKRVNPTVNQHIGDNSREYSSNDSAESLVKIYKNERPVTVLVSIALNTHGNENCGIISSLAGEQAVVLTEMLVEKLETNSRNMRDKEK